MFSTKVKGLLNLTSLGAIKFIADKKARAIASFVISWQAAWKDMQTFRSEIRAITGKL